MTYRSRQHLDLANGAPCMADWPHECRPETVLSAHRNEGKGTGWKRPDNEIAFLCGPAHAEIDKPEDREMSRAAWLRAHWRTQEWLWEGGKLTVAGSVSRTTRRAKCKEAGAYVASSKTVKHPGYLTS